MQAECMKELDEDKRRSFQVDPELLVACIFLGKMQWVGGECPEGKQNHLMGKQTQKILGEGELSLGEGK